MNTNTKFEICTCKNVDVTNKKLILIARFTKGAYGSKFSNYFFNDEFTFQLCTRSEKFACLTLIIRPREVKSSWINLDYKNNWYKNVFLFLFKKNPLGVNTNASTRFVYLNYVFSLNLISIIYFYFNYFLTDAGFHKGEGEGIHSTPFH